MTSTFTVKGMTCSHCVQSITQEFSALPGVTSVQVDLASGGVTVASEEVLPGAAVRAAVDEAGYELADA